MPHRFTSLLLLLLLSVLSGCAMSEKDEIDLGRKAHAQFEKQSGGLYPDPQVQAYVSQVGLSLARYAGRPNLPWQFRVVNSNGVNAFAVPGGYIYITRGLLYRMQNEAQLAGVLGHESAHVAHRHSVKQIENQRFWQGGSLVAGVVGGLFGFGAAGDVAGIVGQLSTLSYSRGQEKEADLTGLSYMAHANYNPRGMVQTMQILKAAGGSGGGTQFFSSHPDPANRIEYLTQAVNKDYPGPAQSGRLGEAEFRAAVLSRRASLTPLDFSKPRPTWCATCNSPLSLARAAPPTQLLHD